METTRASLLLRIRDHADAAAWQEFDAIYRPILTRYTTGRGLNAEQVDDVVQECMAAVSVHIASFEYDPQKGRFKHWLRALVNSKISNLFRKRIDSPIDSSDIKNLQDDTPGPDELFDRIWLKEHLRFCLSQVRAEIEESTYRAFMAYVINEKSTEEVCREMGMTRNQVQLIKWRVMQKVTDKMHELLGDRG